MWRLVVLAAARRRRYCRWPAFQVHVHSPFVFFCGVLEAHLLAYLLDARLDLLDVVARVVAFADDAEAILVWSRVWGAGQEVGRVL